MNTPNITLTLFAALLEKEDHSPCGGCGDPHAYAPEDYEPDTPICHCACCVRMLGEFLGGKYPDLVTVRSGVRVVSVAMVDTIIRRVEVELSELDKP